MSSPNPDLGKIVTYVMANGQFRAAIVTNPDVIPNIFLFPPGSGLSVPLYDLTVFKDNPNDDPSPGDTFHVTRVPHGANNNPHSWH